MNIEIIKSIWTLALKGGARLSVLSEAIIERLYRIHVRPGDIVIDVGANAGRHAFPLAECVGRNGKVYAIEPLSAMIAQLRGTANRIGVSSSVEFLEIAAGKECGQVSFHSVPDALALSSLKVRDNVAKDHAMSMINVQMTTLDDLFVDKNIRFIKLDVEGAEFDVIRGGKNLITRSRPVIAFEDGRSRSANLFGYTMEEFYQFFKNNDYSVFPSDPSSITPMDLGISLPCRKKSQHKLERLFGLRP